MKPTSCFLSLALLLACCTLAQAEPIELRFKPKVGLETKHRMMISGRLAVTTGTDKSPHRAGEATGRIEFTRKVVSETEDQTVVETRQTKGEFVATEEGEEGTIKLSALKELTTYDRRRAPRETGPPVMADPPETDEDGFGCTIVGQMHVGCGMWTGLLDMLELPSGPVAVGSTWEKTQGENPRTVVNYRLQEVTQRAGRRCAKIRVTWQHEYSLSDMMQRSQSTGHPEMDRFMIYQVGDAGDVTWYYDVENSVDVHLEGVVRLTSEQPGLGSTWALVENVKLVFLE
jgi:hypothetical protein